MTSFDDLPAVPELDMPEAPELPDIEGSVVENSLAANRPSFETGFFRLSAEEYYADPCSVPGLSASIAHILDSESPMHAWSRHPRLGNAPRESTDAFDDGNLAHALLLGAGKEVVIVDAKDYRTNAAKSMRDDAKEAGKLPVLAKEYERACKVADKLRQRFADVGISLDGEKELAALWTETASNGATVQCRGMMDRVQLPAIYDIKSTRSAKPAVCRRHIEEYGYAIQRAAYVSAVERIRPELAGRIDFVFVFFELKPPYAVTPMRLSGKFRELGSRAWKRAVDIWEECLRTNKWPGYVDGIIEVEPSSWALAKSMDRDIQEAA